MLPSAIRDEIYHGLLANDIIGFHTRSYRRNFLQCCRDLLDLEVDFERGVVVCDDREVWVRAYPLPIDYEATRAVARRPRVREFEERVLARRREYAILRVDRADLSKNVLRGFTAFDIFLEQHPEFAERITFTAQLMPSRTDVPEYAEYLEKIEALVAVVNHRHGTPDWMPIDLKLRDDLDEAVASYKHYDVMMVNAMFDGMNLVAKEGPLVNERHGVSILSENTGAHEELGEFALSVNPFDVQELADAIYSALMMSPEARERRARGLKEIVTSRDPATGSTSRSPTSAPSTPALPELAPRSRTRRGAAAARWAVSLAERGDPAARSARAGRRGGVAAPAARRLAAPGAPGAPSAARSRPAAPPRRRAPRLRRRLAPSRGAPRPPRRPRAPSRGCARCSGSPPLVPRRAAASRGPSAAAPARPAGAARRGSAGAALASSGHTTTAGERGQHRAREGDVAPPHSPDARPCPCIP